MDAGKNKPPYNPSSAFEMSLKTREAHKKTFMSAKRMGPIYGETHLWRNPFMEKPISGETHLWRNPFVEKPIYGKTHLWKNPFMGDF